MKPILLLDVDGVLRDIVTPILNKYKESNPDFTLTHKDMDTYRPTDKFTNNELGDFKIWTYKYPKEILCDAKPYCHVAPTTMYLSKYFDIHIATYQYPGLEHYTAEWLNKQGATYTAMHFIKDKQLLKGKYIVDDNIDVLMSVLLSNNGCKPICMSQPWNTKWKRDKIKDLTELIKYV